MQIIKAPAIPKLPKLMRVAAYARVSSGKEAMLHSLSAQVDYYSKFIGRNPGWEYAGVYVDEAVTGTKDSRPGFQKMLAEARSGNISLIITKSISRFARNTVTVLNSVRELKSLEVDIFFEEQNIHSLSTEGELMLTILASYAQEESLSASENQKWRVRKNFSEGKVGSLRMFGFQLKDGQLIVVPKEAEIVKSIFADYLSGMGVLAIKKKYRSLGYTFSNNGIAGMLRNEKYAGNLLLQKSFKDNHITKRKVINIGQLPQFYVADSHDAIVDCSTFGAVQAEIARRSENYSPKPKVEERYPFTGLIRCGKCGAPYKRKHAAAGSKYEKIVWICDTFNALGKTECDSQQIPEDILSAKVAEVGGLERIAQIRVPGHNLLAFVLDDSSSVEVKWAHPSRSQSWTPEMKEAARQRQIDRMKAKEI